MTQMFQIEWHIDAGRARAMQWLHACYPNRTCEEYRQLIDDGFYTYAEDVGPLLMDMTARYVALFGKTYHLRFDVRAITDIDREDTESKKIVIQTHHSKRAQKAEVDALVDDLLRALDGGVVAMRLGRRSHPSSLHSLLDSIFRDDPLNKPDRG